MIYGHKNGCAFRKLGRSDLDYLLMLKDSSWGTTHKTAIINKEDQNKWFDALPASSLYLICEHRVGVFKNDYYICNVSFPSKVGLLTLSNIDQIARTASIGGNIDPEWRGTPWVKWAWEAGTDFAFEMLNLNRLDAEVVEYNFAALKLDLDIGYRIEGKRRQAVHKCGKYYDSVMLGLLREEWKQTERVQKLGVCNINFKERRHDSAIFQRLKVPLEYSFSLGEAERLSVDDE